MPLKNPSRAQSAVRLQLCLPPLCPLIAYDILFEIGDHGRPVLERLGPNPYVSAFEIQDVGPVAVIDEIVAL